MRYSNTPALTPFTFEKFPSSGGELRWSLSRRLRRRASETSLRRDSTLRGRGTQEQTTTDGNTSVTIVNLGRRRALAAHVGHADVTVAGPPGVLGQAKKQVVSRCAR